MQENARQLTLKVLLSIKSNQMDSAIGALNDDLVDTLMKYIYRGFEFPSDNSSAHLLQWHEKVYSRYGVGCITRVLACTNRAWFPIDRPKRSIDLPTDRPVHCWDTNDTIDSDIKISFLWLFLHFFVFPPQLMISFYDTHSIAHHFHNRIHYKTTASYKTSNKQTNAQVRHSVCFNYWRKRTISVHWREREREQVEKTNTEIQRNWIKRKAANWTIHTRPRAAA